jgi:hypothetical protein
MLRKSVMLTCVLVLGFAAASEAGPLDSTGMVYIDGLPCNSLCLSYMHWSHELSSTPAQRPPQAVARHEAGIRKERSKPAAQARVATAKPGAPNFSQVPQAKAAGSQPAANAAADIADPHPKAGSAAGSNTTRIQEQVAAALQVTATAVPAPQQKASNTDGSDHPETVLPTNAERTAAASANDTDVLVALVMARPEIRSVSDLASKTVAIDHAQSASHGNVRAAMVAAGATEVQLSDGQTKAVDRLISGAVPAAVLALASPETAQRFPTIEGFRIFRIPLSPRSLKAAVDAPQAK